MLFTYSDIAGKRKIAIKEIKDFIKESIEQNNSANEKNYNLHFKELMYYYFNAKYAKKGFVENGENQSLIDDFKNKELNNWNIFIKYTNILNSKNSFINECKMMRGSCKRILRSVAIEDAKDEYALKLLYAFASFGLNNPYYYEEAQKNFLEGFELLYFNCGNYKEFNAKINEFESILSKSVQYEKSKEFIRRSKHKLLLKINTINLNKINEELNYIQNG